MKDILLLYDAEDADKWKDYIYEVLCQNELNLSVVCKNLRTEEEKILSICSDFLVINILVSPAMFETLSSTSERLSNILQEHACVTVILLYTELDELNSEFGTKFRTLKTWRSFDITDKPDTENKQTISQIVDLLEKEREHRNALEKQTQAKPVRKKSKPGTIRARSILAAVCPERVSKKNENILMVLKQPVEGLVQVSFKQMELKIDTKKLNPYCYSFIAPDLGFGRHHFYVFLDGKKQTPWPLRYVAPTQTAYECPAFLCQALDIPPDDMDSLDRRLTDIFRASLPNDEALSRILSPRVLASEVATSKVDHHFPTLLHFAAFHNLRELCNALLEMPGAVAAFHKKNIDDKDPLDLAEEREHEDLVDYFMAFLEMQETISTYEQFYVHMYDKKGDDDQPNYLEMLPVPGQPGYIPMFAGPDRVEEVDYQKNEDDYEIKTSAIVEGVSEVRADEDIMEEPKPGLPPRKPKKPTPTPTVVQQRDESPPPPVAPRRKPLPAQPLSQRPTQDRPLSQETPEDLFNVPVPAHPVALGSGALSELVDIQEAFKRKDINERDVEMLYMSWMQRYKSGKASASMKERQKELHAMREKYQTLIKTAEKKDKPGFFDRLTKKKKKKSEIQIEPPQSSNPYTSWSSVPTCFAQSTSRSEMEARMSTISTSSSSSYASSSSRDSAMSLSRIQESDSDDEQFQDVAPPVPLRQASDKTNVGDRRSLGEQFLHSVQNKPNSRLPQPPAQYKPRAPAHRSASSPTPNTPAVPPRKTSN